MGRVVIGCLDPDARVSGKGAAKLRAAGIAVSSGILEDEVKFSLRSYLHHRRTGLPYVLLKAARTMDGCVCCQDRTSQWITTPASRAHAHAERAASQAILVGSGTALADNPRLNVRGLADMGGVQQPLRVVLDSRGRVTHGHLLDTKTSPTLIVTCLDAVGAEARAAWEAHGVEVVDVGRRGRDGLIDLAAVLRLLGGRGILQVLVEGGPTLYGELLRLRLVDEMILYTGAGLIGSTGGRWLPAQVAGTMAEVSFEWQPVETAIVEGSRDVLTRYVRADGGAGAEKEAAPSAAGEPSPEFSSVPAALEAIRAGGMVVVMDDENRENEGDIIMAAQFCTPAAMATMIRYTSGIVCVPMLAGRAAALRLDPMVPPGRNEDAKGTAYTVSCDFVGSHTGISAAERCRTANVLAEPVPDPGQICRPGHVFPLIAKDGGVLERRGHTEAAVDLCRLAGVTPVGVISELMNDDGATALLPDCIRFAKTHGMPVVTIDAMVAYRQAAGHAVEVAAANGVNGRAPVLPPADEPEMELLGECTIPVVRGGEDFGNWQMHIYSPAGHRTGQSDDPETGHQADDHTVDIVAMVKVGEAGSGLPGLASPLFRLHSQCMTGDLLGSTRCDCGEQLTRSFQMIHEAGAGALIYIPGHEGRGIGLIEKVKAYRLMEEEKVDTYAANVALGHPADLRSYDGPAAVLRRVFLGTFQPHGARSLTLLTGNPLKAKAIAGRLLDEACVDEVRVASLDMAPRDSNRSYLAVKAQWANSSWGAVSEAYRVARDGQGGTVITRRAGGQCANAEPATANGADAHTLDGLPPAKVPKRR